MNFVKLSVAFVVAACLFDLNTLCLAQSISVSVTTYGQSGQVCSRQSSVTVVTQSAEWYKSAITFDKPCASVNVTTQNTVSCQSAPTYIWQQSTPVVIEQPIVQYVEPITVPVLQLWGPTYYRSYSYYPSYWEYPTVYGERANINATWRLYGFGGGYHSAQYGPRYFPPVRNLPYPQAGRPFPQYHSYPSHQSQQSHSPRGGHR